MLQIFGMIKAGSRARLDQQALTKGGIRCQLWTDALDGDAAIEPQVFGDEHLTHAAGADPEQDTVGRGPLGSQSHDARILQRGSGAARKA